MTSILTTGLTILVELIDVVNLVVIFLSQTTLLRWLTFLPGSQTVILTLLLFWIYLFLDASICSTMAFPPLGNYVVVSVSIDLPSYSPQDAPFHHIVYDYSGADWDSLCDHLRDVTLSVSAATFPDCWKVSSVVLVFKNAGETSTAKNCHPDSLLSVVSKVFEKLVNNKC